MKRVILISLVLAPWAVHSQNLPRTELNVSAGYLFEGEVYVWQPLVYGSVGETFLLKVDYTGYFSDFVGLGGYFALTKPYYYAFENVSLAEVGVVGKARFKAGDKFLFKLPLYLGYRMYGGQAGKGPGVNLSGVLECLGEKFWPFIEFGFLTQPAGGNDFSDMTFSPVLQASLGVCLGFQGPKISS